MFHENDANIYMQHIYSIKGTYIFQECRIIFLPLPIATGFSTKAHTVLPFQIQTVPVPNCQSTLFSTLFCLLFCLLSVLLFVILPAVLDEQSAQLSKSCGSSCLRTNLTSSVPSKSTTARTKVCSVTFTNHSVLNGSGVSQLIRQIYHVLPHVVSQREMSGQGETWAHSSLFVWNI